MCLSGRCSSRQHAAIDVGINHHDLYEVVRYNANRAADSHNQDREITEKHNDSNMVETFSH